VVYFHKDSFLHRENRHPAGIWCYFYAAMQKKMRFFLESVGLKEKRSVYLRNL